MEPHQTRPISFAQSAINMDEMYAISEEQWPKCITLDQKQFMSRNVLWWCKRQRDQFDQIVFDKEPTDVSNLDNWVDVDAHEQKWAERVDVWQARYNEAHS